MQSRHWGASTLIPGQTSYSMGTPVSKTRKVDLQTGIPVCDDGGTDPPLYFVGNEEGDVMVDTLSLVYLLL